MFHLLPRVTLIAACLVLAGTGALTTASAVNEDCQSPPHDEDLRHPSKGFYLYIPDDMDDAEDRARFGWWQEKNGRDGLQLASCSVGDILMYEADKQTDVLLP